MDSVMASAIIIGLVCVAFAVAMLLVRMTCLYADLQERTEAQKRTIDILEVWLGARKPIWTYDKYGLPLCPHCGKIIEVDKKQGNGPSEVALCCSNCKTRLASVDY